MDALLTLSSKGQLVIPARELIGCSGYAGPAVPLERMDPALVAVAPQL